MRSLWREKLLGCYLNSGVLDAEHTADTRYIAFGVQHIWFEATLVPRGFVLQVVTAVCTFAHQLSCPGHAEALAGTIMSFPFRHCGRSPSLCSLASALKPVISLLTDRGPGTT